METRSPQLRKKARANHSVKFAIEQHLVRLAIRWDVGNSVALREFHLHARVWRPGVPFNVVQLDAVFVLQRSPHPDRRGLWKLRQADSLPHEILRLANAAFRVDEDIRVTKCSRREN